MGKRGGYRCEGERGDWSGQRKRRGERRGEERDGGCGRCFCREKWKIILVLRVFLLFSVGSQI